VAELVKKFLKGLFVVILSLLIAAAIYIYTLLVTDLHADNLLWRRDPEKRNDYGQVDFPRLREGGVNIQVFSAVTKSPRGLNFDGNDADAPDDIALSKRPHRVR